MKVTKPQDKDPDHDLKLRFLKLFVNVPLKLISKLVSFPRHPHYPQTLMIMDLHATLKKIYGFEVVSNTFGAEPDGNFERLLDVSAMFLAQICERDRYYRAWIGLLVFLAEKERRTMTSDPEVLKRWIHEQWDINADCLSDENVKRFAADFQEIALCDYLGNLACMKAANYKNKK